MANSVPADPDDWYVACSDDEKYTSSGCPKGKLEWTPNPEDMLKMYKLLDEKGVEGLPLEWACLHGRRPKTPPMLSDDDEGEEEDSSDHENSMRTAADVSNFDFDADEDDISSTTTPRRPPLGSRLPGSAGRELKGSARKMTTKLSTVLSKMQRNRKKDVQEAASAANTPKAP